MFALRETFYGTKVASGMGSASVVSIKDTVACLALYSPFSLHSHYPSMSGLLILHYLEIFSAGLNKG
jgi:hypothetical protein